MPSLTCQPTNPASRRKENVGGVTALGSQFSFYVSMLRPSPTSMHVVIKCLRNAGLFHPNGSTLSKSRSTILHPCISAMFMSFLRTFHDGRPRGPLWRGRKMISKEAVLAVTGLKRHKSDEEKLDEFVTSKVCRLLKMDMIAVLNELERQGEVSLALKVFSVIQREDWYKPDIYMFKDLIVALARNGKMDEALKLWQIMRKDNLFPDFHTYAVVLKGLLNDGSHTEAMNLYEEMKKSPRPPDELPFKVLLKGLLPHPLLRNKVKQDYEELFPERHVYDPPEEIFGAC